MKAENFREGLKNLVEFIEDLWEVTQEFITGVLPIWLGLFILLGLAWLIISGIIKLISEIIG